jgi:hypothetical protein
MAKRRLYPREKNILKPAGVDSSISPLDPTNGLPGKMGNDQ